MVSRPRQLQRDGRKSSRKLLLIPTPPACRQPRQVPDRNDERSTGHSRLGKIVLLNGKGLRKSPSDPYQPHREGNQTATLEDSARIMLEDRRIRRWTFRCSLGRVSNWKGRDVLG